MKINDVLAEMSGAGRIHDARNLPEELEVGDVFATKYGPKFKVEGKEYDENLNDYRYTAFSIDRIMQTSDPEEANDHLDFVFTIENGKPKPVSGSYASVVKDHL